MARSGKSVHAESKDSKKVSTKKPTDYTSEGVKDQDVFLLPGSDYQVMIVLTLLGAVVRLFRIYQPSSVVFDEVQ
jgi:dolichyl-phosphate-mannose-protein mannosyltransferase